jgi:hypothetical protein
VERRRPGQTRLAHPHAHMVLETHISCSPPPPRTVASPIGAPCTSRFVCDDCVCVSAVSSMLSPRQAPPFWVSLALLQAYLSSPVPASAGCPVSFQRPLQVELSWPFANNDIGGRFCSFRLLQHAWCEWPRAFLLFPHHAPGRRARGHQGKHNHPCIYPSCGHHCLSSSLHSLCPDKGSWV